MATSTNPDVTGAPAGRNFVLPAPARAKSAVVILDERALDCDLATAIQRVRADEATRRSRILIIGPEEPADAGLELNELPSHWAGPVSAARREAAQMLAGGLLPLLGCQERFYAELRETTEALDEAVPEASRARLKNHVHVLGEILEWCHAVHEDLQAVAQRCRSGQFQLDIVALWHEVATEFERQHGLPVTVSGSAPCPCWGDPAALREAFWWILGLTAQRIGGTGTVQIEVGWRRPMVNVRVLGQGEPHAVDGPLPARIRELLVERHGAVIRPDSLGAGGTGLVVQLPTEPPFERGALRPS